MRDGTVLFTTDRPNRRAKNFVRFTRDCSQFTIVKSIDCDEDQDDDSNDYTDEGSSESGRDDEEEGLGE